MEELISCGKVSNGVGGQKKKAEGMSKNKKYGLPGGFNFDYIPYHTSTPEIVPDIVSIVSKKYRPINFREYPICIRFKKYQ